MISLLSYSYATCLHNMVKSHMLYLNMLPKHYIFMIVYDVLCMPTSFTMSISYVFVRIFVYIYIYIYIQDGRTALIRAAIHGRTEMADLLIRSNADVNVKGQVRTNTIYIIYIPQTTSTVHIYVQIYKYTLIYIQNPYYYIHISAYRYSIYNICMLIKLLISICNIRYMLFSMEII